MRKSSHTSEYADLRDEMKAARKGEGLSQRDLAQRLQVPHSWVAKVESGERRIDLIETCWFLDACGVDPVPVLSRIAKQLTIKRSARPAKGGR